jgi:hypothetical protein
VEQRDWGTNDCVNSLDVFIRSCSGKRTSEISVAVYYSYSGIKIHANKAVSV